MYQHIKGRTGMIHTLARPGVTKPSAAAQRSALNTTWRNFAHAARDAIGTASLQHHRTIEGLLILRLTGCDASEVELDGSGFAQFVTSVDVADAKLLIDGAQRIPPSDNVLCAISLLPLDSGGSPYIDDYRKRQLLAFFALRDASHPSKRSSLMVFGWQARAAVCLNTLAGLGEMWTKIVSTRSLSNSIVAARFLAPFAFTMAWLQSILEDIDAGKERIQHPEIMLAGAAGALDITGGSHYPRNYPRPEEPLRHHLVALAQSFTNNINPDTLIACDDSLVKREDKCAGRVRESVLDLVSRIPGLLSFHDVVQPQPLPALEGVQEIAKRIVLLVLRCSQGKTLSTSPSMKTQIIFLLATLSRSGGVGGGRGEGTLADHPAVEFMFVLGSESKFENILQHEDVGYIILRIKNKHVQAHLAALERRGTCLEHQVAAIASPEMIETAISEVLFRAVAHGKVLNGDNSDVRYISHLDGVQSAVYDLLVRDATSIGVKHDMVVCVSFLDRIPMALLRAIASPDIEGEVPIIALKSIDLRSLIDQFPSQLRCPYTNGVNVRPRPAGESFPDTQPLLGTILVALICGFAAVGTAVENWMRYGQDRTSRTPSVYERRMADCLLAVVELLGGETGCEGKYTPSSFVSGDHTRLAPAQYDRDFNLLGLYRRTQKGGKWGWQRILTRDIFETEGNGHRIEMYLNGVKATSSIPLDNRGRVYTRDARGSNTPWPDAARLPPPGMGFEVVEEPFFTEALNSVAAQCHVVSATLDRVTNPKLMDLLIERDVSEGKYLYLVDIAAAVDVHPIKLGWLLKKNPSQPDALKVRPLDLSNPAVAGFMTLAATLGPFHSRLVTECRLPGTNIP